jgi:hypothetical protein
MRKQGPTTRGSPERVALKRRTGKESAAATFQRVGLSELCSLSSHTRHFAKELKTASSAGKHRHFN